MMFGFRDAFAYTECANCGCIQIDILPENIEKYYPDYYYSFHLEVPPLKRKPFLKRLFKDQRIRKIYRRKKEPFLEYLKAIDASASSKILDVGCGSGQLICRLFNEGFEYVAGVDKFIPQEINYGYGVKILKNGLDALADQSYDVVMMHHVLEHVEEQLAEMKEAYRVLKKNGHLIVRIPVKSAAWEKYHENWVQLDAPRHYFLHTQNSFEKLASDAGFVIKNRVYDSTAFQFWSSELYRRDLALYDGKTPRRPEDHFSQSELQEFTRQADALNNEKRGDQAVFYLAKSGR
ncbi:MAG: class I SAM-dependent methyltransferase [Mucilaginibacter polytrichastri]|nr:class I SAM-dependent methyltransferase [Mucilaginibacter polytrichastri]